MEVHNLSFVGEVNQEMLPQVLAVAQHPDMIKGPVQLWVSGPGGDFPLTCGIVDLLRQREKITISFGEVCSASVLLAASGTKTFRLALPGTMFGLHEPYVVDSVEDPASARATEQLLKIMRFRFYELMKEFTGRRWEKDLAGKSMLWLSAADAKILGLVDEVRYL